MSVDKCIIATGSVTYAMKGAELLAATGIRRRVVRLRSDRTKNGCSYGISISCADKEDAVRILISGGVKYTEILDE